MTSPQTEIKSFTIIIGILFMCQFVLVSYTFPLSELLSATPHTYIDNIAHWYRIKFANDIAGTGNLMGYNPYFGAGSISGVLYNPGAKIPAIFAVLLKPFITEIQAWKLFVFFAALLGPLCVPLSLKLLNLENKSIVAGAVFGLILWWTSMFRWFHTAGLVSFVLAAYVSLAYFSLVVRFLNGNGNWLTVLILGILGAIGTLTHPLFPLPIIFATTAFIIIYRNNLSLHRSISIFFVVPVISLLPNLIWLYPAVTSQISSSVSVPMHQSIVDASLIWREMIGQWQGTSHGSRLNPLLVIGTAWAFYTTDKNNSTGKLMLIFTLAGIFMILFAAFGAASETIAKLTQPNRFSSVGYLFLCIPASIGVANLFDSIKKQNNNLRLVGHRTMFTIILLISLFSLNEVRREISYEDIGHYGAIPPEIKGVGEYSEFVIDWINTNTTNEGRILFETSNGRIHDNGHMAGYYAYITQREFIGGHYPFEHFAGFWDGFLFGRPIEDMTPEKFQAYAKLYNIGWIIAFSNESKRFFNQLPIMMQSRQFKELSTYRVNTDLDFFIEGSGYISERTHNKLVLKGVSSQLVTIKYHYYPGIATTPKTRIEPVNYLNDPIPFISFINPPEEISLYFP